MRNNDLSPRQLDVLQLSWDGLSVKDAAKVLGLSDKSVKNYRAAIYEKFGVRNVEGMIRQGVERGYIKPNKWYATQDQEWM